MYRCWWCWCCFWSNSVKIYRDKRGNIEICIVWNRCKCKGVCKHIDNRHMKTDLWKIIIFLWSAYVLHSSLDYKCRTKSNWATTPNNKNKSSTTTPYRHMHSHKAHSISTQETKAFMPEKFMTLDNKNECARYIGVTMINTKWAIYYNSMCAIAVVVFVVSLSIRSPLALYRLVHCRVFRCKQPFIWFALICFSLSIPVVRYGRRGTRGKTFFGFEFDVSRLGGNEQNVCLYRTSGFSIGFAYENDKKRRKDDILFEE